VMSSMVSPTSIPLVVCLYGNVIYGTIIVYLTTCTTVGTALTIIGTKDGSTLPLVILCALKFVLSCSPFIF
jgi:hypothetical protein